MPFHKVCNGNGCFGVFRLESYENGARGLQDVGGWRPYGVIPEPRERKTSISIADLLNPEVPQFQAPEGLKWHQGHNHEWQSRKGQSTFNPGSGGIADLHDHNGRRRYLPIFAVFDT